MKEGPPLSRGQHPDREVEAALDVQLILLQDEESPDRHARRRRSKASLARCGYPNLPRLAGGPCDALTRRRLLRT